MNKFKEGDIVRIINPFELSHFGEVVIIAGIDKHLRIWTNGRERYIYTYDCRKENNDYTWVEREVDLELIKEKPEKLKREFKNITKELFDCCNDLYDIEKMEDCLSGEIAASFHDKIGELNKERYGE